MNNIKTTATKMIADFYAHNGLDLDNKEIQEDIDISAILLTSMEPTQKIRDGVEVTAQFIVLGNKIEPSVMKDSPEKIAINGVEYFVSLHIAYCLALVNDNLEYWEVNTRYYEPCESGHADIDGTETIKQVKLKDIKTDLYETINFFVELDDEDE